MPSRLAELSCAALMTITGIGGCGAGELPDEYWTEHLEIRADAKNTLCRGDLISYEKMIRKIEDELEVEMQGVTKVFIWDYDDWHSGPIRYCASGDTVLGCTNYARSTVYTSRWSLPHELVHATTGWLPAEPFFIEGIADAYADRQTRFGGSAPSANEGTSPETMDRATALHFVRWLRERWGPAKLSQLLHAGRHSFDEFERVYGGVDCSLIRQTSRPRARSPDNAETPRRSAPRALAHEQR